MWTAKDLRWNAWNNTVWQEHMERQPVAHIVEFYRRRLKG